MKKAILFLFTSIIFAMPGISQTKVDTLKNETVIKLTKAKLQESIIIQKISKSVCSFDVSTDALIRLRENNVSDKVIELMISKQDESEVSSEKKIVNNSTDQNYVFTESGIYFFEDGKYTMLDPTNVGVPALKPGFIIPGTYKYKSQLEGSEANYQLKEKHPTFYFNFEPAKKSLNNSTEKENTQNNYMAEILSRMDAANGNASAISPNDFKLIKLDQERGRREYTSGSAGIGRTDMSIADGYLVNFKYEKVSGHTYKVSFPVDLKPGQYCFLYANKASARQQSGAKAFDFSVKK